MKRALGWLCVAALLGVGCSAYTGSGGGTDGECTGKCDGAGSDRFQADLEAMKAEDSWKDGPLSRIEDAFSVKVSAGEQFEPFMAATHIMDTNGDGYVNVNPNDDRPDDDVTLIPYADNGDADLRYATGEQVLATMEHIDQPLSNRFGPGEIGWAIKHHRVEHRKFDLKELGGPAHSVKEQAKNQDTHIELVVGVDDAGKAGIEGGDPDSNGVITLNSPQSYEDGRFDAGGTYPMIFVKPQFPDFLRESRVEQEFRDNIRTMMVAFNAVSSFPGEYNGGDPLGAYNPEKVRLLVSKMVQAIAGDEEAKKWFQKDENLIYCAELAHVSASAGLIVPTNERSIVDVLMNQAGMSEEDARAAWDKFAKYIEQHNAGKSTPFVEFNSNKRVAAVKLSKSPSDLQPASAYAPASEQEQYEEALGFRPMTAADIITTFIRTHIPRRELGEKLAPAQAKAFEAIKAGILENMDMKQVTEGLAQLKPELAEKLKSLRQGAATHEDIQMLQQALEQAKASGQAPEKLTKGLEARVGFEKLFRVVLAFLATDWRGDQCRLVDAYADYGPIVNGPDAPADAAAKSCEKLQPSLFDNFWGWAANMVGMKDLPETPYGRMYAALNADFTQDGEEVKGPLTRAREAAVRDNPAGGLFVPPSLLHTTARGDWKPRVQGVDDEKIYAFLDLSYVGHGMHYRFLEKPEDLEVRPELRERLADAKKVDMLTETGEIQYRGQPKTYTLPEAFAGQTHALIELNTTRGDTDLSVSGEGVIGCSTGKGGLQAETCMVRAGDGQQYDITVRGMGMAYDEETEDPMPNEYTLSAKALYAVSDKSFESDSGDMQDLFQIEEQDLPDDTKQLKMWMRSDGFSRVRVYESTDQVLDELAAGEAITADPICDAQMEGSVNACSLEAGNYTVTVDNDPHTQTEVLTVAK